MSSGWENKNCWCNICGNGRYFHFKGIFHDYRIHTGVSKGIYSEPEGCVGSYKNSLKMHRVFINQLIGPSLENLKKQAFLPDTKFSQSSLDCGRRVHILNFKWYFPNTLMPWGALYGLRQTIWPFKKNSSALVKKFFFCPDTKKAVFGQILKIGVIFDLYNGLGCGFFCWITLVDTLGVV